MNYTAELSCSVCSDRAEGYHFGAVSCAACGAFFRRSISDQKTYSCNTKSCPIIFEVRAKRSIRSFSNSFSFLQNVPQTIVNFIQQISDVRRQLQRQRGETLQTPSHFSSWLAKMFHSLQEDFRNFSLLYENIPILKRICLDQNIESELWMGSHQKPQIHNIFLKIFISEICLKTCHQGGIQLDRLVFPNLMFLELNNLNVLDASINIPHQCVQHFSKLFTFLVQVVSRTFQIEHFDENDLSIIDFLFLTDHGVNPHPQPEIKLMRDNLLIELNRINESMICSIPRIYLIVQQLCHGFQLFKSCLQYFNATFIVFDKKSITNHLKNQ